MEQNLSQYRIFYEVARSGSISRAARELYVSQPAISKAISKLEDGLDTVLFSRNSRGVQLTEEGAVLYEHIRKAFDELTLGEQELKRFKEFHMGHIRIGVSNTLCRFIMLDYLKGFIDRYPHIKVTIESQSTTHTLTMLEQQHIDIGLVARPATLKDLRFIPVQDIQDIFVAAPNYLQNLRLREGADADVFQVGNVMLLDRENVTRRYIDDYMAVNHIEANSFLEVTTMDLLIEFARIGLGIGCVIREFVEEDLRSGRLVQVRTDAQIHKRTVGFAYCPRRTSRAVETFLSFVQESKDPVSGRQDLSAGMTPAPLVRKAPEEGDDGDCPQDRPRLNGR